MICPFGGTLASCAHGAPEITALRCQDAEYNETHGRPWNAFMGVLVL
jgi:hypothetical protein